MEPKAREARRESLFMKKIKKSPSGCWLWRGSGAEQGTPQFRLFERVVSAQYYALVLAGRRPRRGTVIIRTCGNRRCVCPDHLEAVTPRKCGKLANAHRKSTSRINRVILARLRRGPTRTRDLVRRAQTSSGSVGTALNRLKKQGLVRNLERGVWALAES